MCDRNTFNFTGLRELKFLCVADEAAGRILPFSFLNEVIDAFSKMFRGIESSCLQYHCSIVFDSPSGDETGLGSRDSYAPFRVVLNQKMNKYSGIGAVESEPSGHSNLVGSSYSNSTNNSSTGSLLGLPASANVANGNARDLLLGPGAAMNNSAQNSSGPPSMEKVKSIQRGLEVYELRISI